ncbi:MAG: hypothetical protein R2854_04545 [Caldilineaceae bacterium]
MVAQARQNVHARAGRAHPHRAGRRAPAASPTTYADFIVSRSTIHHHWAEPVQAFLEMSTRAQALRSIMIIHGPPPRPAARHLAEFNRRSRRNRGAAHQLGGEVTVAEIWDLLEQADIADLCTVGTTEDGIAAIGFEIRMRKVTEWA